ncbi:hypothetical protein [Catellatospora sp. NPDC049133]|jgi:hypothetical protein|uniref:hypothetical protein n=1 Tax=Catellatospora sp. NPDC049133 TaxID=3155499 RepID=UPI0033DF49ED
MPAGLRLRPAEPGSRGSRPVHLQHRRHGRGQFPDWYWNNAGTGNAYQIGLSPQGATAASTCEFEVVRDWYAQRLNSGASEIEYWFTVKNTGAINCNADVTLAWNSTSGTTPTMSAAPGETAGTWYHYDTSPASTAISVALIPSGATAAAPCQYEVERVQVSANGDERRHGYTITNVGTITCQVTLRVTALASSGSWSTGSMTPMSTKTWRWNNANPLTAAHVVTLSPNRTSATSASSGPGTCSASTPTAPRTRVLADRQALQLPRQLHGPGAAGTRLNPGSTAGSAPPPRGAGAEPSRFTPKLLLHNRFTEW